mgnify:CR=1 FL=1
MKREERRESESKEAIDGLGADIEKASADVLVASKDIQTLDDALLALD